MFNDISDHVALVQLMDNSGNMNHAVSITGHRMYYSNYIIALTLMK